MNWYCLIVTYNCNWNCPYCITDTHNNKRSYVEVLDAIDTMECGHHVNLSGGEPGLLSTEELMCIINKLKSKGCTVSVDSNGEIFNHPEVVGELYEICYHCSVNMDIDDYVNKEHREKVNYLVVVTDDNIHNLKPFLNKHNDIQICIVPARSSGVTLSRSNAIKIVREYRDTLTENEITVLLNHKVCHTLV